jgi:hypothetical protein
MTFPGAETINAGIMGLDCRRRIGRDIGACPPFWLVAEEELAVDAESVEASDTLTKDDSVAVDAIVTLRSRSAGFMVTCSMDGNVDARPTILELMKLVDAVITREEVKMFLEQKLDGQLAH